MTERAADAERLADRLLSEISQGISYQFDETRIQHEDTIEEHSLQLSIEEQLRHSGLLDEIARLEQERDTAREVAAETGRIVEMRQPYIMSRPEQIGAPKLPPMNKALEEYARTGAWIPKREVMRFTQDGVFITAALPQTEVSPRQPAASGEEPCTTPVVHLSDTGQQKTATQNIVGPVQVPAWYAMPNHASGEDVKRAREVMAEALLDDENPAWNERTVQVIASAIIAAHAQGRAERSKLDEAVVEAARKLGDAMDDCQSCDAEFRELWDALATRDAALKAIPEDAGNVSEGAATAATPTGTTADQTRR